MNHTILSLAVVTALGSAFVSGRLTAPQDDTPLEFPAASPASTLKQRVGLTDIEINYSRPSMKGRKVFGGLEPYGSIWRTGANSATTISFSTDVTLGGARVPAGTYALFSIPGEKEWTIILSKATQQFGAYRYDEKDDLARFTVPATALGMPVESLAFGIGDLRTSTATLYFEWESTRVSIPLTTNVVEALTPKIEAAMAADGDRPYFPAAMFYYENGCDLDKAALWIDEAVKANPTAFWVSYRKGLILEKKGDKKGAIEAATMSLNLAKESSGAIKAEYTRLNEALIARCQ